MFTENAKFRIELARLVDESYPIVVGRSLEGNVVEFLTDKHPDRRAAVTTGSNVAPLTVEGLLSSFSSRPAELVVLLVEEASKTCKVRERVEDEFIVKRFGRDTMIVAFGGDVIIDLADFMAATSTREVPYVSLTTTLLGAVDAVTGGKATVDIPAATNLIGVLHQLVAVLIDLGRWFTLSDRQTHGGLGETIKHTCIADTAFFEALRDAFVERGLSPAEFVRDDALTELTAGHSCGIKHDLVTSDAHEGNKRMGLNLGYTIDRALETTAGYTLNHGECVAIGLALRPRLEERLRYCSPSGAARIEVLLRAIDLPTKIPKEAPVDRIMEAIAHNKKSEVDATRFVFQDGVGCLVVHNGGSYVRPVAAEGVCAFLQSQM